MVLKIDVRVSQLWYIESTRGISKTATSWMCRSGARPRISTVAGSQFLEHRLDDAVQTEAAASQ